MRGGARVDDPLWGGQGRGERNGVEGVGEVLQGLGCPGRRGRLRRRRIVRPRSRRVESWWHAGYHGVIGRADARRGAMWANRGGAGPHMDGLGPRIEQGRPLSGTLHAARQCRSRARAVGAALTASATVASAAGVGRQGPSGRPRRLSRVREDMGRHLRRGGGLQGDEGRGRR